MAKKKILGFFLKTQTTHCKKRYCCVKECLIVSPFGLTHPCYLRVCKESEMEIIGKNTNCLYRISPLFSLFFSLIFLEIFPRIN